MRPRDSAEKILVRRPDFSRAKYVPAGHTDPWSPQAAKNIEQGTHFLKQRDNNLEQNLVTARTYFALARGVLLKSTNPDPESFTQTYYQLMNVEMEMSYKKQMSAEEKMSHLQAAEFYGSEASSWARSGGSVGSLAQVALQQAVLKGRRAEVDARRGMSSEEVRRQKDEAIAGITAALKELQYSKRPSLEETTVKAMNWRNRFSFPASHYTA